MTQKIHDTTEIRKIISVIIPIYNEQECLKLISGKILETLPHHKYRYEIIFINDGSTDLTQEFLISLSEEHSEIKWINLSRNFGHQAALKAGIDHAIGDCVISMDGDLQHPPTLLPLMIQKWEEGYDVVYTRRKNNQKNSFKNITSNAYYKILNALTDIHLEAGVADFRLTDKKVNIILQSLEEVELFFRGLIKWVGFKSYAIDYEVANRYAGTTKYSLPKMMRFALDGITSFSTKPLFLAIHTGLFLATLAALYFPYALWKYFDGTSVSGWTSLIMVIVFLGGIQIFLIGIIGIYISKIFKQTKKRPVYLIQNSKGVKDITSKDPR